MLAVSQQQGGAEKVLEGIDGGSSATDTNVPGEHPDRNSGEFQQEITTQNGNYLQPISTDFRSEKRYGDNIGHPRQETNCSPGDLQIDLQYAMESTYDQLGRNQIYNSEFACNSGANTLVVQQPMTSDESVASSHSSYSGNIQVM